MTLFRGGLAPTSNNWPVVHRARACLQDDRQAKACGASSPQHTAQIGCERGCDRVYTSRGTRLEQQHGEERAHADAELDHEDAPVVGVVHRRPVAHPAADQAANCRRPEKQRLRIQPEPLLVCRQAAQVAQAQSQS